MLPPNGPPGLELLSQIAAPAQAQPELDRGRVERRVREFGAALELPELWESVKRLM